MTREIRAARKAPARLSRRPLCKRWRARRSRPCDKKPRVPRDGCLLELGPAIEMMPASVKPLMLRKGPAGTGSSETRQKAASFTSAFPGELPGNLENNFQLDRCAERKACDANHDWVGPWDLSLEKAKLYR